MREARIFDCVLYRGEEDALEIRLQELAGVVDQVVIVEIIPDSAQSPVDARWNPNDPRFAPFAAKVRHVVAAGLQEASDRWQQEAVLRGLPDAEPDDLVLLSEADEIPRATAVRDMAGDTSHSLFSMRLVSCCYYVNCRNAEGPETIPSRSVAARRREFDRVAPHGLRHTVMNGSEPARIIERGGWHFSRLVGRVGKQPAPALPAGPLNVVDDADLPEWVVENRFRLAHLFEPRSLLDSATRQLARLLYPQRRRRAEPPVIICPYLYAHEAAEIRAKFDLDGPGGKRLPFFLWQDAERVGPERAYEHCWNLFPERDIVIVHSDMAPMPDDPTNGWYERLLGFREELPRAGMLACNLFYPRAENLPQRVQCAGGIYRGGRISHLTGDIGDAGVAPDLFGRVREVDWVTFGGVLIRRNTLRACGPIDPRYHWAYMIDTDYCLEARLRGFRLYQVPVALMHEESRTTRPMLDSSKELQRHMNDNAALLHEKWRPFLPLLAADR